MDIVERQLEHITKQLQVFMDKTDKNFDDLRGEIETLEQRCVALESDLDRLVAAKTDEEIEEDQLSTLQ